VHPDYPVLDPATLFNAIEALYSCSSCLLDDDPLYDGWPSGVHPFCWNKKEITPGRQNTDLTMPVVAFIVLMVFNIAAIVKVRSRIYEFSPERYYRSACIFTSDCFARISLPAVQALVMLIVHCVHTPAEANLWTLIHVGMAHCIELGIHREQPFANAQEAGTNQIKRLVFYTLYSLDRYVLPPTCSWSQYSS
jgi:hypothetical protein